MHGSSRCCGLPPLRPVGHDQQGLEGDRQSGTARIHGLPPAPLQTAPQQKAQSPWPIKGLLIVSIERQRSLCLARTSAKSCGHRGRAGSRHSGACRLRNVVGYRQSVRFWLPASANAYLLIRPLQRMAGWGWRVPSVYPLPRLYCRYHLDPPATPAAPLRGCRDRRDRRDPPAPPVPPSSSRHPAGPGLLPGLPRSSSSALPRTVFS